MLQHNIPIARYYPWYTPYQFAGNTPIQAIDLDGLEPIIYIDVLNKPTGFNRTTYANELKERLVQNGAHPALQVKFKDQLSTIEKITQFFTHSNIKGQNVEIQLRNYDNRSDPDDAGGFSDGNVLANIVTVYNGLTGSAYLDPNNSVIPVTNYVSASMHEIGHKMFKFMHNEKGETREGKGVMDYRHAYDLNVGFTPTQQKIIYALFGFGNPENPAPASSEEEKIKKKQLQDMNLKTVRPKK